MHNRRFWIWTATALFALAALQVLACGDDDGDEPTITVSGRFTEFSSGTPLADVELCIRSRPDYDCAVSDAQGNFALTVPADEELLLTADISAFQPLLVHYVSGNVDVTMPGDLGLLSTVEADVAWGSLGEMPDATKGSLLVTMFDDANWPDATGIPEASIALTPAPGGTLAYFNDDMLPDDVPTATNFSGVAGVGNATPGDYVLTVTHPTLSCHSIFAFAEGAADSFRVTIQAGRLTWVLLYCE